MHINPEMYLYWNIKNEEAEVQKVWIRDSHISLPLTVTNLRDCVGIWLHVDVK